MLVAGAVSLFAADGTPATVVTLKGESIEGRFLGATGVELTIETTSRLVTLQLREVSYISFVGRPRSAEAVSYAMPSTPSSQRRAEGSASERAGRLEEALLKYEEAARLDPTDPLTIVSLGRVRRRVSAQKAAPYLKLAVELRRAGRYGAAAACYEEAVRLDPYDKLDAENLSGLRKNWAPTSCPFPSEPVTGR